MKFNSFELDTEVGRLVVLLNTFLQRTLMFCLKINQVSLFAKILCNLRDKQIFVIQEKLFASKMGGK